MNNYWETNYKASQEGRVTLRYSIKPHHGPFNPAEAKRFGLERHQPLIVVPTDKSTAVPEVKLRLDSHDVIVTSIKPSEDGHSLMVRLFNATDKPQEAELAWKTDTGHPLWISNLYETRERKITGPIRLPPWAS